MEEEFQNQGSPVRTKITGTLYFVQSTCYFKHLLNSGIFIFKTMLYSRSCSIIFQYMLLMTEKELITTPVLSDSDIEIESCLLEHLSLFQTNQIMPLSC